MIGRVSELATLVSLARSPGVVLVSGEAGIGKTTLIGEALSSGWGDRPNAVIRTRCRDESRAPFAALAEALRVSGVSARAVTAMDSEGIVDALASAVPPAGLLVIEDLHWAAPDTIDLLPRLEERLFAAGSALLASYRSAGLPRRHRIRWLKTELRRNGRLREVMLAPLRPEETAELVRSVLPASAELVAAIHERSRGVPFYARELAAAVAKSTEAAAHTEGRAEAETLPLPESVRDAIAAQLDGLDEEARINLFRAATIGTDIEGELFLAVHGDPDLLLESGFVSAAGAGELTFNHSLVRDAIRAEIPWQEGRALHESVAQALASRNADPRRVADHWLAAGERERCRAALVAAVEAYDRAGAVRDAARAARDALRIWPETDEVGRIEMVKRLARYEQSAGELEAAARAYREIADHPLIHGDPRQRGQTNRSLATVLSILGREQEAFRARQEAEAAFRALDEPAEVALELLQQLPGLMAALRLSDSLDAAVEAETLARRAARPDIQARALGHQGHLLAMAGRVEEGREAAQAGFDLAVKNELTAVSAETYRRLGGVLEYSSDLVKATDVYQSAVARCRRAGAEDLACDAMGCMCYVVYRTGDYTRSLEIAREVLKNSMAPPMAQATALMNVASVRTMRGELKGAERAIREAEKFADERGYQLYLHIMRMPRAALLLARGSQEAAIGEYRALLDATDVMEDRHVLLPGICHAAGLFADRGEEDFLTRAIEFLTRIESETGDPEAAATLAHALGAAASLASDLSAAHARFVEAASRFAQIGVPVEEAHAELRAGLAALAMGDVEESNRRIGHARSIGRRIGARQFLNVLAHRVDSTEAPGDERAEVAASELLSPRQLEVAKHLVEGMTNKEIAAKLFVSTRTVEMHVAHIMDRLNCRSRTEAATRLKGVEIE